LQLLDQKVGNTDVHREDRVKVLDGRLLERGAPRYARIGDDDVQAATNDEAGSLGQEMRSVRRTQIGGNEVSLPDGLTDFGENRRRFAFARAVMEQHLGASLGECQGRSGVQVTPTQGADNPAMVMSLGRRRAAVMLSVGARIRT
jgi:hypothetical protein